MIEELEINPSNYYKTKAYLMKTTIDLTNNNACSTQRKHKEYATKGTSNKERSSKVRTRKVSNNREYIMGNKEDEVVVENYSNNKGFPFQSQTKEKRNKERKERKEKDRNDNHPLFKALMGDKKGKYKRISNSSLHLTQKAAYKQKHGISPPDSGDSSPDYDDDNEPKIGKKARYKAAYKQKHGIYPPDSGDSSSDDDDDDDEGVRVTTPPKIGKKARDKAAYKQKHGISPPDFGDSIPDDDDDDEGVRVTTSPKIGKKARDKAAYKQKHGISPPVSRDSSPRRAGPSSEELAIFFRKDSDTSDSFRPAPSRSVADIAGLFKDYKKAHKPGPSRAEVQFRIMKAREAREMARRQATGRFSLEVRNTGIIDDFPTKLRKSMQRLKMRSSEIAKLHCPRRQLQD